MPKEVKVIVNADGTTKTDFSGFQGPSCLDAAEQLRKLLAERFGIQSQETGFEAKPELHYEASEHQQRSQQKG